METSVIVNVMIRYDKSTREGRCYEWLCKILIHDSSRRFLYPILSKSKRAHPFSHCEQTSTVLPLRRKMQFFPEISRVTFFDRIGHRPGKYEIRSKRNSIRGQPDENRKSILIVNRFYCSRTNESFSFYSTASIRIPPFFFSHGSISGSLPLYVHGAVRERNYRPSSAIINRETNRKGYSKDVIR